MIDRIQSLWEKLAWSQLWERYVCFEIFPYQNNELWIGQWEWFLANFSKQTWEWYIIIQWNSTKIKLLLFVPDSIEHFVENVFYSNFPTSQLKQRWYFSPPKLKDHSYFAPSKWSDFLSSQWFSQSWWYIDPFKEVLSFYQTVPDSESLEILYTIKHTVKKSTFAKLYESVQTVSSNKDNDEEKDWAVQHKSLLTVWIWRKYQWLKWAKLRIESSLLWLFSKFLSKWALKVVNAHKQFEISTNSFVNMFHLPTKENHNPLIRYVSYRKLPAPTSIPVQTEIQNKWITILWSTEYKSTGKVFWIQKEDKFRHVYIVWKTWMGKSTFMSNMVRSDMQHNNWLAVVDPHGDLIEDVMAHIPSSRTNDVVLFDVSDTDYPVWFNILEYENEEQKNLVASWVISIFKKLYGHSRWPRLEYILRNVMLSVLEYPNATLMHITRMLTDKSFREEVLHHVTDPIVLKFRKDEYGVWNDKQRNEAVWPITNKIGQFLSSTIVRNIFAQPKSAINIRKIMDEWKILLINLSKWRIGEDNASMIWSFLVTKFQIDAMSRADIDFKKRKDFYLYIDEFQNFATDSFESILSEARKYRLSLVVANQYTSQIEENIRNAIFGNVGTIVSFGLGYDDATIMSQQFKQLIVPNDLLSLPKFKAYIKLMVDWVTVDPFTMATFPLPDPDLSEEIKQKIRRQSRQRYAMEKSTIEWLLAAWSQKRFTQSEKVVEKAKRIADTSLTTVTKESIQLWSTYNGLVKLKYNYWLFVTVQWVEWLLHKSKIPVPSGVKSRKWLYEIWDSIRVKAIEWKEVSWEKKIVRGTDN